MPSIERPISSQTFGSRTHLIAPTPERAPSMRRTQTPEPESRPTLVRSHTPSPQENQADIARMFAENMFSDPAPQKAWKFGPKLFSDGHQRLIYMLREECGRLYSFSQCLKQKVTVLERQNKANAELIAEMRHALHSRSEKLAQVNAELREQYDIVQEMDADMERTRTKRLSRIAVPKLEDDTLSLHRYPN